jgi:heme/copper-type cytochrome/quinol oxidase subunit 2
MKYYNHLRREFFRLCSIFLERRLGLLWVFAVFCYFRITGGGGDDSSMHIGAPVPYGMDMQIPATPVMEGIKGFHTDLTILLFVIGAFVLFALLGVVYRYHEFSGYHTNPYVDDWSEHATLEIVWTIIPTIILFFILVPSLGLLFAIEESIGEVYTTIHVVGRQWFWSYYYPSNLSVFVGKEGVALFQSFLQDKSKQFVNFTLNGLKNQVFGSSVKVFDGRFFNTSAATKSLPSQNFDSFNYYPALNIDGEVETSSSAYLKLVEKTLNYKHWDMSQREYLIAELDELREKKGLFTFLMNKLDQKDTLPLYSPNDEELSDEAKVASQDLFMSLILSVQQSLYLNDVVKHYILSDSVFFGNMDSKEVKKVNAATINFAKTLFWLDDNKLIHDYLNISEGQRISPEEIFLMLKLAGYKSFDAKAAILGEDLFANKNGTPPTNDVDADRKSDLDFLLMKFFTGDYFSRELFIEELNKNISESKHLISKLEKGQRSDYAYSSYVSYSEDLLKEKYSGGLYVIQYILGNFFAHVHRVESLSKELGYEDAQYLQLQKLKEKLLYHPSSELRTYTQLIQKTVESKYLAFEEEFKKDTENFYTRYSIALGQNTGHALYQAYYNNLISVFQHFYGTEPGQFGTALPLNYDSYMVPAENINPALGQFRNLSVDAPLVMPSDCSVKVLVTASDVIHSWAVPAAGIKMDGVPGRLNRVFVHFNKPGIYYGQCSEICGTAHALMPIQVVVVPRSVYEVHTLENMFRMCVNKLDSANFDEDLADEVQLKIKHLPTYEEIHDLYAKRNDLVLSMFLEWMDGAYLRSETYFYPSEIDKVMNLSDEEKQQYLKSLGFSIHSDEESKDGSESIVEAVTVDTINTSSQTEEEISQSVDIEVVGEIISTDSKEADVEAENTETNVEVAAVNIETEVVSKSELDSEVSDKPTGRPEDSMTWQELSQKFLEDHRREMEEKRLVATFYQRKDLENAEAEELVDNLKTINFEPLVNYSEEKASEFLLVNPRQNRRFDNLTYYLFDDFNTKGEIRYRDEFYLHYSFGYTKDHLIERLVATDTYLFI